MALVKCKECGTLVSLKAEHCLNCGALHDVDEPPDVPSIWEVEYDYMLSTDDYELFPNGSLYASGPLAQGNISLKSKTDPSENPSHAVPVDVLQNYDDLIRFFNRSCVPELGSDGAPIMAGTPPRKKLYYGSYLAGINVYNGEGSNPDAIGLTFAPGVANWSMSVIYVDRIRLNQPDGRYSPYDAQTIVEAVTVHELGHTRAYLSHLCEYPHYHNDSRCIMSLNLPKTNCQNSYDVIDLGIRYCDSCKAKLKRVKW